jgi:hypothetical protein
VVELGEWVSREGAEGWWGEDDGGFLGEAVERLHARPVEGFIND